MKFRIIEIEGHNILEVEVKEDRELLQKAENYARRKSAHIATADPSGRVRDTQEILNQNFLGSLADIVCAEVLMKYFSKHNLPIQVIQYDAIRIDRFLQPDLFDIKLVSDSHNEYIVEIRSSACIYISLKRMVKEWQVLGPYSSSSKGNFEEDKSFYMRPLYHLDNYQENIRSKLYSKESGMEYVKSGKLKLYIVGGATDEMMRLRGRNEAGEELKQGRAEFKVVNILDALDVIDFLGSVTEIVSNNAEIYENI